MKCSVRKKQLFAISSLLLSLTANATTSLHNNAHIEANATELYESWLSDNSTDNDPFYKINYGYKSDKVDDTDDLFATTVSESTSAYYTASYDYLVEDVSERKSLQEDELTTAYALASADDEFDYDLYLSEFEDYLDNLSSTSTSQSNDRYDRLIDIADNTDSYITDINSEVLTNESDATQNLIDLMIEDYEGRRDDVLNLFSDNIEDAESTVELSTETLEIAALYADECTACSFIINEEVDVVNASDVDDDADDEDDDVVVSPEIDEPTWKDDV